MASFFTLSGLSGTCQSPLHEQIESFLETAMQCLMHSNDQQAAEQPGKAGRPVSLPSMSVWMAVLVAVLRGLKSQRAIWRLLAAGGWWRQPCYDIEDQAVYKRQKPRRMDATSSPLRTGQSALSSVAPASLADVSPTACNLGSLRQ